MPDVGGDFAMKHTKKLIAAGLLVVGGVTAIIWRPEQTGWNPPKDCKKTWVECDTYRSAGGYMRLGFNAYRCPDGYVAPAITASDGSALFDIAGECKETEAPPEAKPDEVSAVDFACVMPDPKDSAGCLRRIPERTGLDGVTRPEHLRFAMQGEYFPKAESVGNCLPSPCVLIAGLPFER